MKKYPDPPDFKSEVFHIPVKEKRHKDVTATDYIWLYELGYRFDYETVAGYYIENSKGKRKYVQV